MPTATPSRSRAPAVRASSRRWTPRPRTSGFTRSIVLRAGLTPADVRAGARGSGSGSARRRPPVTPSLISTGVRFASPSLTARPAAGETVGLTLPFKVDRRRRAPGRHRSQPALGRARPGDAARSPRRRPARVRRRTCPSRGARARSAPPPIAPLPPPDGADLVVAEQPAEVVAPVAMSRRRRSARRPGRRAGGSGPLSAHRHAPRRRRRRLRSGARQALAPDAHRARRRRRGRHDPRRAGHDAHGGECASTCRSGSRTWAMRVWGAAAVLDPTGGTAGRPATQATARRLVAPVRRRRSTPTTLTPALEPGATTDATIALLVPRTPGIYTLVLDLVTPEGVSLMASGHRPDARTDHGRRAAVGPTRSRPRAPRLAASPDRPMRPCSRAT